MTHGTFIALEGIEGCGKSTQAKRLYERLRTGGIDAVHTFEPGGTPAAAALRALLLDPACAWQPMSELLLFTAARLEHAERVIRPALAAGRWVVCDRSLLSTLVYQGIARGLGEEAVMRLHRLALGNFEPDRVIVLDLPAEAGLARAKTRAGQEADRFHEEALAFHQRVRQGFLTLAARDPQRITVIDASGDAEAVEAAIARACAAWLTAGEEAHAAAG